MAKAKVAKSKASPFAVRELRREARRMFTIEAAHSAEQLAEIGVEAAKGALVRIRPGAIEPAAVEVLRAYLVSLGAAEVKVLPPDRAAPAVAQDAEKQSRLYSGPREAVLELCAAAVGVDPEALAALCGELMDAEGM